MKMSHYSHLKRAIYTNQPKGQRLIAAVLINVLVIMSLAGWISMIK